MKRILAIASLLAIGFAVPAEAWWQYAEWGLNAGQIASASGGRTGPCRADAKACATPPGGARPSLLVENVTMVGLPASVSFAFDDGDRLVQTVVYFPGAGLDLIESLLQGVHGQPADARATPRVWRDARRGTDLTASQVGQDVVLLYRPTNGR